MSENSSLMGQLMDGISHILCKIQSSVKINAHLYLRLLIMYTGKLVLGFPGKLDSNQPALTQKLCKVLIAVVYYLTSEDAQCCRNKYCQIRFLNVLEAKRYDSLKNKRF